MLYGKDGHRYELVDGWAQVPEGVSFVDVGGLSIDSQDRVYVLNRGAIPVMVFDRNGKLLTSWGKGFFNRPHGTCIGPDGSVYCTDDGNHLVSKFTPTGELLMTLGKRDQPSDTGYHKMATMDERVATILRGGPPFNRPTGVALSSSGEIYVTDGYGNARVHKFSPDGTLLFSWGEPGQGEGQFRVPHCVRVDKQERVWIADRENSRIQIFDAQGKFIRQWADIGGKPCDMFFDPHGDEIVYVTIKSEERPHGLSIFTTDGKLVDRWGSQGPEGMFVTPHAVVVDSRGDLFVGESRHDMAKVDVGSRALRKFVKKG